MTPAEDPLATPGVVVKENLDYENDTSNEGLMIKSNVNRSTLQQLQLQLPEQALLDPQSNDEHDVPSYRPEPSFIEQFAKTKGPPQITFLMMLVAIGLGSTIAVVPAVMTDRFARLNHGYNDTAVCSSFDSENDRPQACYLGSADAQNAAASSNLISNVLTFLTSSLIGSLSDEYGRRGKYVVFVIILYRIIAKGMKTQPSHRIENQEFWFSASSCRPSLLSCYFSFSWCQP
jgi:hypothetical protein